MDQQAKLAQAATVKREEFREELVSVYLALEKLPAEPLPLPKLAAQVPGDGPGMPAPPPRHDSADGIHRTESARRGPGSPVHLRA
eukprot:176000-Amphidinium_carterae.1